MSQRSLLKTFGEKVVIAIPREPMDFMCRAVEAGHPRSVAIHLPPVLQEVVPDGIAMPKLLMCTNTALTL